MMLGRDFGRFEFGGFGSDDRRLADAASRQSADLVLCDRIAADPSDPDKPADILKDKKGNILTHLCF